MGAKLVVRETQNAVFVNEGKLADVFTPGTYSLRILRGPAQVASRRVTVSAERTLRVDPLTMKKRRGN